MKKEYRITGRIRKDEKRHVVDFNKKWTLQDAQKRLKEIEKQEEHQRKNKSDYDLLELRIECRDIIPWEIVQSI